MNGVAAGGGKKEEEKKKKKTTNSSLARFVAAGWLGQTGQDRQQELALFYSSFSLDTGHDRQLSLPIHNSACCVHLLPPLPVDRLLTFPALWHYACPPQHLLSSFFLPSTCLLFPNYFGVLCCRCPVPPCASLYLACLYCVPFLPRPAWFSS